MSNQDAKDDINYGATAESEAPDTNPAIDGLIEDRLSSMVKHMPGQNCMGSDGKSFFIETAVKDALRLIQTQADKSKRDAKTIDYLQQTLADREAQERDSVALISQLSEALNFVRLDITTASEVIWRSGAASQTTFDFIGETLGDAPSWDEWESRKTHKEEG